MEQEIKKLFTAEELVAFRNLVTQMFLREGYTQPIFEEWFAISDSIKNSKIGLFNIAQMCALSSMAEWEEILSAHFERIFKSDSESEEYNLKKEDFENIKSQLRLQLYPADYLDQIDFKDEVVIRTDVPGTLSQLMVDLPSNIQGVLKSDTQKWNVPEDRLFFLALENTLTAVTVDSSIYDAGEIQLKVLNGEDILSAVHVLNLDAFNGYVGTHGALVSIPTRHYILCYPIENLSVVKAIQIMATSTNGMNNAGPGSLSPLIYWYKDGVFRNQPYSIEDNSFNLSPTDEFLAELNLLK